ncbi:MAG TPA: glycosyltransferase, partial [Arthrobacter sp.]|nr:glycosyltransferase [Arthrobacter sp.]
MAKADVGFALIVKDGEKTLEACLKSIRPHVKQIVVGIDTLTKDKTERIAKRYADEVFPVKVSDWHECEQHGRVRAQDFARARNESFKHLDPDLGWWAWADADDVLEGAELLPRILADVPPQVIGFWSRYLYAYVMGEDGRRVPNTVFDRERILRTQYQGQRVDWQWKHRVHEVVAPDNFPHPAWAQEHRIQWVHQHQAHKSESSAPRNLLLLEIELEEKPDDPRTVFYMGNQYFATGDWALAAQWYENYAQLPEGVKNPYELWQAYVYMSLAYERLGDLDASLQAAFGAIDARPEHPEPYYRLAAIYSMTGQ